MIIYYLTCKSYQRQIDNAINDREVRMAHFMIKDSLPELREKLKNETITMDDILVMKTETFINGRFRIDFAVATEYGPNGGEYTDYVLNKESPYENN